MTSTLLELSRLGPTLGLEGHLPECSHLDLEWLSCSWCGAALSVPQIEALVDLDHDARLLLGASLDDTVAWVVAAGGVLDAARDVQLTSVLVPSVRTLGNRLRSLLRPSLDALAARLDAAAAAGGPVERRCRRSAGAVAATALQDPAHRDELARMSPRTRSRIVQLSNTLSEQVQLHALFVALDGQHWRGMPPLRTQPEWERRPRPGQVTTLRAGASGGSAPPGSLEALVIESVIDEVTDELVELGPEMDHVLPAVELARDHTDAPLSSATRSIVWRIARIDWHLTFLDSGRADGWASREEDDRIVTCVPWQVARAIRAGETHGLVSATHQGAPRQPVVSSGANASGGTPSPCESSSR